VSRHLHCDPFRDTGADEIADGGSAEVVQDPTGASGVLHADRNATLKLSMGRPAPWNTRGQTTLSLPLEILGHRSLLFRQFTQFVSHRKGPALAVLRFPWIEPHFAGAEIDLAPLERQDLAVDPPAGDVGERRRRPNGFRELRQRRQELITLGEPRRERCVPSETGCAVSEFFPAWMRD
jgi:hypothetical protein